MSFLPLLRGSGNHYCISRLGRTRTAQAEFEQVLGVTDASYVKQCRPQRKALGLKQQFGGGRLEEL